MKKPTAFFDVTQTGDLISRMSADTQLVAKGLTDNVSAGRDTAKLPGNTQPCICALRTLYCAFELTLLL
jgi:hypothetical protein